MRNEKYHLYLTEAERKLAMESLLNLRSHLLKNGKFSDGADDLIVKFARAKRKKYTVR